MSNVAATLDQRLTPSQLRLARLAGEESERLHAELFLVGGTVRDMFLGVAPRDLDLCFAGDPDDIPSRIAPALDARIVSRSQFGTFKLETGKLDAGREVIDVAMARRETYERPGALPTVAPGSIDDDLARRDFSINAMAVGLTPVAWGELLDPFGGRDDVNSRVVRVLHGESFVGDPTRILRAVRYAARLGFRLDTDTEGFIRRDLEYIRTLSGDRVRHELERIFHEDRAVSVLELAQGLGVLRAIYPPLALSDTIRDRLREIEVEQTMESNLVLLSALAASVPAADLAGLIARLNMSARWAGVVRDTGSVRDAFRHLAAPDIRPSQLHALLRKLDPVAIEGCTLITDDPVVAERLGRFQSELRAVETLLDGDDLLALGLEEGPLVGELLDDLLAAKLDGQLVTAEDEREFVARRISRSDG